MLAVGSVQLVMPENIHYAKETSRQTAWHSTQAMLISFSVCFPGATFICASESATDTKLFQRSHTTDQGFVQIFSLSVENN
jgi:hypothetical protein